MKSKRQLRQKGFTLIELLVVLAILAMLAGLVGPSVMSALSGAKSDAAAVQLNDLGAALNMYHLDVGHYPPSANGMQALLTNEEGSSRWSGPYLNKKKIPKDPWGYDFQYKYPGENGDYDLISLGADHAAGGEGNDRDVVSWE